MSTIESAKRSSRERHCELQRLARNYDSEHVTPRMRNHARRELQEDDLAALALLNERAAAVRRSAAGALEALSDPNATWEVRLQQAVAGLQGVANYVLVLHELLQDVPDEPYQEPER